MTNEKQKPVTDQYRSNYDEIFKRPKQKEECCNHDCNQGRDCPHRKSMTVKEK